MGAHADAVGVFHKVIHIIHKVMHRKTGKVPAFMAVLCISTKFLCTICTVRIVLYLILLQVREEKTLLNLQHFLSWAVRLMA